MERGIHFPTLRWMPPSDLIWSNEHTTQLQRPRSAAFIACVRVEYRADLQKMFSTRLWLIDYEADIDIEYTEGCQSNLLLKRRLLLLWHPVLILVNQVSFMTATLFICCRSLALEPALGTIHKWHPLWGGRGLAQKQRGSSDKLCESDREGGNILITDADVICGWSLTTTTAYKCSRKEVASGTWDDKCVFFAQDRLMSCRYFLGYAIHALLWGNLQSKYLISHYKENKPAQDIRLSTIVAS